MSKEEAPEGPVGASWGRAPHAVLALEVFRCLLGRSWAQGEVCGGVADGERKLRELQAATKPPQEPRAAATRTPSRGSRGKKKSKATLPTQLCKTLGKTPHPPQKHSPQRQGWLSGRCSLFPSEGFRPVQLQEQRRAVCGVPRKLE